VIGLAALGLVCGCVAPTRPESFFQLSAESPAQRATQTRIFEAADPDELLSASAAVLQDLGFQVEESVRELGFIRAAKERSAREYGQEIVRALLMLGGSRIPVDLQQKIAATLVCRPLDTDGVRREVRIMFYRVIWKGDGTISRGNGQTEYIPPGEQRMAMIRDPEIYRQFFAKLSKAVFLEAHKI
jgi:hypothetical protein